MKEDKQNPSTSEKDTNTCPKCGAELHSIIDWEYSTIPSIPPIEFYALKCENEKCDNQSLYDIKYLDEVAHP